MNIDGNSSKRIIQEITSTSLDDNYSNLKRYCDFKNTYNIMKYLITLFLFRDGSNESNYDTGSLELEFGGFSGVSDEEFEEIPEEEDLDVGMLSDNDR